MKIDYIDDVNEYGDHMVRLYDLNMKEAILFREALYQTVIVDKKNLDLSTIDFIESRNCTLELRISDEDNGIVADDNQHFVCELTYESYQKMIFLLEPFCKKETKGYQFLYDVDSPTDFLFSPAGTW